MLISDITSVGEVLSDNFSSTPNPSNETDISFLPGEDSIKDETASMNTGESVIEETSTTTEADEGNGTLSTTTPTGSEDGSGTGENGEGNDYKDFDIDYTGKNLFI